MASGYWWRMIEKPTTDPRLIVSEYVIGIPKAQPRVKAVRRGNHAGVYDPGTANEWKALVKERLAQWSQIRSKGALFVRLNFFLPRPKSHYGTGKNATVLKASAPKEHTVKPDIDNLEKAVFDALSWKSGSGVWHDDSQIIESLTKKGYANNSKPPGMFIYIREIAPQGGGSR